MNDPKLENLLNLALDATEREREKSLDLNVGYLPEERSWELIVRYAGDLDEVRELYPDVSIRELLRGFAIMIVPESQIDALTDLPQIIYVEKPKRLNFVVNIGRSVSCINPVQTESTRLTGRGVLVGIVDSGIDYYHPDFRNEDGSSRILYLWDQSSDTVYTGEEINAALKAGSRSQAREKLPLVDHSGHGTAVAAIAAGNGRESQGRYRGVAYESDLIVVKLGTAMPDSFPRTTQLMEGVDFVIRRSLELDMPVAINLSFGMNYGSHTGSSLLESYLNEVADVGRNVIVAGTGNEAASPIHTSGVIPQSEYPQPFVDIPIAVSVSETVLNLQLWKNYVDNIDVELIHPSGRIAGPFRQVQGPQRYVSGGTEVLVYYGEPSPYSLDQEIYIDFIPVEDYIDSGIWTLRLTPNRIIQGNYELWLPSGNILNRGTGFLYPTPDLTLTIPSTAAGVLSVGAYDARYQSYADFSGRGFVGISNTVKPDLVAPGVGVMTASAGGGYAPVTGTSFAAPFVTGAAALLMEDGIVQGSDPYLYGEKVKAYLRRGARQLPGFDTYPNPQVGYGALCVRDSLPF